MPGVNLTEQLMLSISTSKSSALSAHLTSGTKHPFPLAALVRQATIDRLQFAGDHLRAGDNSLFSAHYRSAISRYYYAMYHASRAIVFAESQGDDHERHQALPRNLPGGWADRPTRESELTDARLLRNQADYDVYPMGDSGWEADARGLAVTAAHFVLACENFATTNGHI